MIYYHNVREILVGYLREKGVLEGMKNILQMLSIIIQEGEYKIPPEEEKKDATV